MLKREWIKNSGFMIAKTEKEKVSLVTVIIKKEDDNYFEVPIEPRKVTELDGLSFFNLRKRLDDIVEKKIDLEPEKMLPGQSD